MKYILLILMFFSSSSCVTKMNISVDYTMTNKSRTHIIELGRHDFDFYINIYKSKTNKITKKINSISTMESDYVNFIWNNDDEFAIKICGENKYSIVVIYNIISNHLYYISNTVKYPTWIKFNQKL